MRVIVPPKDEQIEIANYLKERTTAIDQLSKNIEAQIEKLQELRDIDYNTFMLESLDYINLLVCFYL